MSLVNPYLDFFYSLPAAFRQDASRINHPGLEMWMPEWLTLKAGIARHFAWAVPNDEAIFTISKHTNSVLEVGAGNGYWAWLMRQAGIRVTAIDVNPPAVAWSAVGWGDERTVPAHPEKSLMLCWPPWGDRMAANALLAYGGEKVIYIGEWLGGSAEQSFFAWLAQGFECIDCVPIPRWCMRDDALMVFRRRGATTAPDA